ncbi:hypothetical protein [uncultured Brachyspira sp.]|uniref:hypothetical protein n=1 Tax=uncultured Brachyspira sp. TaxID=221953 RepID=UPI0025E086A2|nr:hypothetical protein [uncultured Brachyspira sp.]
MNKKLLLITVIATALLLSCSNKNTTGVGYKDNSALSSNEANTSEINTEINDKEDITKHKGTWKGELKLDTTLEYLNWKFEIKTDASIDVYISGSNYPEPNISFDKISKPKENTLEFTVTDYDTSYKTTAAFNNDNKTAYVIVEVSFTDEENQAPVYYRGTMIKQEIK